MKCEELGMKKSILYPFTRIVGQENMKLALILNVINPNLNGVLIKGEKGTAKSTAVRAIASLLESSVRENHPMRVVELPVSATEDRVVGTLDIEHAIQHGEKKFEPGILAEAHGNILYVDEVNLLDDHVVDVLLDAAAMGVNTIEREGISYSHPARFVLVGTMNPEEGDIRPQMLDRFGLSVYVTGEQDPEMRMEVIKRRLAFETNPEDFELQSHDSQNQLREKIKKAQEILGEVQIPDELIQKVIEATLNLGVEGHRADIIIIKASKTLAAYEGRIKVSLDDVKKAALLVLPHRMRRQPFDEGRIESERIESLFI